MTKIDDTLSAALDAVKDGDAASALEHVLSAWRIGHTPELAVLVDAVATVAEKSESPIDAGTETSQDRRWYARAANKRAATFGLLLPGVTAVGCGHARARVEALGESKPDPRLSRAILGWLERPPYEGGKRRSFCPQIVAVLAAIEDPASVAPIAAMAADRKNTIRVIGKDAWPAVEKAHAQLAKLAPPSPLDTSARATIAKIEAALAVTARPTPKKKNADALLADVYASPDDDGPRLVYADALTEAGDPRGELIVLQCERARTGAKPSPQESKLLRGYARTWLGAIEPVILKDGVVFERGFFTAGRFFAKLLDHRKLDSAPEWSTVVELDVERQSTLSSGSRDLILQPHLCALRRVSGMQTDDLVAVAKHKGKLAWTDISIDHGRFDEEKIAKLVGGGIPSLPALRGIGFVGEPIPPTLTAKLAKLPLDRFHANIKPADLDAHRRALAKTKLAHVAFRIGDLTIEGLDPITITFGLDLHRGLAAATAALASVTSVSAIELAPGTVGAINGAKLGRRDGKYGTLSLTALRREMKRVTG